MLCIQATAVNQAGCRATAGQFVKQRDSKGGTDVRKNLGFRVSDLSGFCSGSMMITIESSDADSERHATYSVPKAHNVTAQGNALGKCETNVESPQGAK